jgi:hypothetical protein
MHASSSRSHEPSNSLPGTGKPHFRLPFFRKRFALCFGKEKNWKYGPGKHINALTSEAGENFSPLVLFNVTTLDHQPIHEIIADTGAGVSAITTKLANEIGVEIKEVSVLLELESGLKEISFQYFVMCFLN